MISENQNHKESFWVYPNPSNDWFKIESEEKIENIKIFNSSGNLIYQQENLNTTIFNYSNHQLPKGIYFVSAEINNKMYVKKIMVL